MDEIANSSSVDLQLFQRLSISTRKNTCGEGGRVYAAQFVCLVSWRSVVRGDCQFTMYLTGSLAVFSSHLPDEQQLLYLPLFWGVSGALLNPLRGTRRQTLLLFGCLSRAALGDLRGALSRSSTLAT